MAILKNILEESLAYYQDLERRYLKRLAELPRGSLLKRRLAGHDYSTGKDAGSSPNTSARPIP
ncbi:MAG: hypothetical protein HYV15_04245 [Elusimicrobia bacterium]|nr:hypothetical protein [Elusimicrobiota bacterium]